MSLASRLVLPFLFGLLPALGYVAVAELAFIAWSHDLQSKFGMAGLLGGMILGVITMPAQTLGGSAFREVFYKHFGRDGHGLYHKVFVDAQADNALVALCIYAAAVALCATVIGFLAWKRLD